DYAFDPFILMREDGSFAYLNDLALERWGYTREEAQNLRVPDVDPIYHFDKYNEAFALAQKQAILPFETLHRRKDGHIYPVEVSMGGITLKGKPHMFAIARDITDRKKYEEVLLQNEAELQKKVDERTAELGKANEQLLQVNKEMEQFTYAASHDMQEPLRKIQTYSSMLQTHCINLLDEKEKSLVSKINSSANRMKRIIDDLLNYSHQTKESQQLATIDLNKVVEEIKEDLELLILEKKATLLKGNLPQ
ncbi:MAG: sensor histidine kinase, partial [Segetibacter sp.]